MGMRQFEPNAFYSRGTDKFREIELPALSDVYPVVDRLCE